MELREHRGSFVEREPFVVSEKILPAPECAIVFVVSCLAFRFIAGHSSNILSIAVEVYHLFHLSSL